VGKIFAFTICLKQIFWAQQNFVGHKRNLGGTAPEYHPVATGLLAWSPL